MIGHIEKEQRPRADERRKGTGCDIDSESWMNLPWKQFRK